jgi:hypothetical protein
VLKLANRSSLSTLFILNTGNAASIKVDDDDMETVENTKINKTSPVVYRLNGVCLKTMCNETSHKDFLCRKHSNEYTKLKIKEVKQLAVTCRNSSCQNRLKYGLTHCRFHLTSNPPLERDAWTADELNEAANSIVNIIEEYADQGYDFYIGLTCMEASRFNEHSTKHGIMDLVHLIDLKDAIEGCKMENSLIAKCVTHENEKVRHCLINSAGDGDLADSLKRFGCNYSFSRASPSS